MVKFKILSEDLLRLQTDLIVVSLFKDIIPLKGKAGYLDWRLNGRISRLIKEKRISGLFKETSLFITDEKIPAKKILLFGFGQSHPLPSSKRVHLYATLVLTLKKMEISQFALAVDFPPTIEETPYPALVKDIAEGLLEGFQKIQLKEDEEISVTIVESEEDRLKDARKAVRLAIKERALSSLAIVEKG